MRQLLNGPYTCNWNHRNRRRENRSNEIHEGIMAENFSNEVKDAKPQNQKPQRRPNKPTKENRHITFKIKIHHI